MKPALLLTAALLAAGLTACGGTPQTASSSPTPEVSQAPASPLPSPLAGLDLTVFPVAGADQVSRVSSGPDLIYTADGRVLDWSGQTRFAPQQSYDYLEPFASDGVAVAVRDGLFGYVDLQGEELVPCRYRQVAFYHDGVLLAGSTQEGFTAYDTQGAVLGRLDGSINDSSTQGGYIQYQDQETGLYGYLRPDGSVAVEAAYTQVYPFSGGYAAVRDGSGLAGFLNTAGELVIPCQFDLVTHGFNDEGYAVVGSNGSLASPLHTDGKLGIINTAGELVVPMEYDALNNFSDGLCLFSRWEEDGTIVTGYLTPDGRELIPPDLFQDPGPFVSGRAVFLQDGLVGLMDRQFQPILPAVFTQCILSAQADQAMVLLDDTWYRVELPPQ